MLLGGVDARGENSLDGGLFSEIRMSDTLESGVGQSNGAQTSKKAVGSSGSETIVLGATSLARLLTGENIDCDVRNQVVGVKLSELLPESLSSEDRAAAEAPGPIRLTVDADAGRIEVTLPLRKITDVAKLSGPKLFDMLASVSSETNVCLTAENQVLGLRTSISNRLDDAGTIRTAVKRLLATSNRLRDQMSAEAGIAKETNAAETNATQIDVAAIETTSQASKTIKNQANDQQANNQQANNQQAGGQTQVSRSIAGTWSAKTSATDAWAMRLGSDGQFLMVHAADGKNSTSKGRFQFGNDRLSLGESGGVTLVGAVRWVSNSAFAWDLQDKNGKVLTTLNFKKQ